MRLELRTFDYYTEAFLKPIFHFYKENAKIFIEPSIKRPVEDV